MVIAGWWFRTFGRIIPTDFHIFQRAGSTTNQIDVSCENVVSPWCKYIQVQIIVTMKDSDEQTGCSSDEQLAEVGRKQI